MSDFDCTAAPFDQFASVRPLAQNRSGRAVGAHARHQLYAGREKRGPASVLIKVTSKPGTIYEQNLTNEIASLSTVNRELPGSTYFPVVRDHGRLRDGRVFLVTSLFDEFPLATAIGPDRIPTRMVGYLKATLEIAAALTDLHRLEIFHVDLNPMNILYRTEKDAAVIRIVDFESSYERARHSAGVFYNPPTTPGYAAPELSTGPPDARADLFSLGAVLYTMLAGYQWTWQGEVGACVAGDRELDPELKQALLRAVDPDRARRYPTVDAFRTVIASYLERIWPGRAR